MMAYSGTTLVQDLEMQVEHWRQRAEAAESVLFGDGWDTAVPPLSLPRTRIMRLLSRRPMTGSAIVDVMAPDYPRMTEDSLKSILSYIRAALPANIAPIRNTGRHGAAYDVPDRDALRAFLEGGV